MAYFDNQMTNEISSIVSDYLRNQRGVAQSSYQQSTRPSYSVNPMAASIVASSVANAIGTVIGHPLDTIRVRQQTDPRPISARFCACEALKNEGTYSLYKGISQPLVGVVPANTVVFYVTEKCRMLLNQKCPEMSSSRQSLIGGAVAGFASLSIFVPLELLKCRAQVDKQGEMAYSKIIKDLYQSQGVRGLYRGFWATAWRDTPAWAVYFALYEYLKEVGERLIPASGSHISTDQSTLQQTLWAMNAGGVAGMASWLVSIPQDVIKTQQQTHCSEKPLSIVEAYKLMAQSEGGVRQIFRGLHPALARGYIVNMVTLPMYDAVKDRISSDHL